MRLIMLAVALLVFAAHAQEAKQPCKKGDMACAREVLKHHPAKKADFWKAALAKPVEQRMGAAPGELIEILALDNVVHGYPNKPRAPRLTAEFMADVRKAFAGIPEPVKRRLTPKLAGIYFVDDIGGTGFTDEIEAASGEPTLGFIILDPSVLTRKANEWASWKDNTPFKPDPRWKLTARIEEESGNSRANAIQYILLHEIGHVLSIGENIHPSWTLSPREVMPKREYPYFQQSWRVSGDTYESAFDAEFPQRRKVVFYFGAKLEAGAMLATYTALERTSFPTLYAATHPGDDFAEAFANYVHVVLMKRPFEISLEHDGKVVKTYAACWSEARCRRKKAFLERYLAN